MHTQILLATTDKQELKETGLFFSKLWGIVLSKEWANLTEENGDGISSEASRRIQRARVNDNSHNLLGSDICDKLKARISEGTHHFQTGTIQKKAAQERISDGSFHLLGGKLQKKEGKRKFNLGIHPMIKVGEIPCIDTLGNFHSIPKEIYISQKGSNQEFFHVNSKLAKQIKLANALQEHG